MQVGELNTNGCDIHLNEQECRDYAESEPTFTFNKVASWDNHPKGCFSHVGNMNVFFNTHGTGGPNVNAKPVCKPGGYLHLKITAKIFINFW